MYRLNDDDGRAVDLLLDSKSASNGDGNGGGYAFGTAATPQVAARLAAVEQILHAFGQMPATEPPTDLVARTMQAIDQRVPSRQAPIDPAARPAPRIQRPQA